MKKNVVNEINEMKYLFTYSRGRILSEQEKYEGEDIDIEDTEIEDFNDEDYDEDFNYLKGEMDEEWDASIDDDDDNEEWDASIYDDDNEEWDASMDKGEDLVPSFDGSGEFKGMSKPNGDMEIGENKTKEKERTITTPGIKPGKKPGTPYSPKPGPKKNPKAKSDKMPDWLSFDELGIEFE